MDAALAGQVAPALLQASPAPTLSLPAGAAPAPAGAWRSEGWQGGVGQGEVGCVEQARVDWVLAVCRERFAGCSLPRPGFAGAHLVQGGASYRQREATQYRGVTRTSGTNSGLQKFDVQ